MFEETEASWLQRQIVEDVFNMVAQRGRWFVNEEMCRLDDTQPALFDHVANLQERIGFSPALNKGVATITAILGKHFSDQSRLPIILPYILGFVERERIRVFGRDTPKQWRDTSLVTRESGFAKSMELFSNRSLALASFANAAMIDIKKPAERRNYFQGLLTGLMPFWYMETPPVQSFLYSCPWFDLSEVGVLSPLAVARGLTLVAFPNREVDSTRKKRYC